MAYKYCVSPADGYSQTWFTEQQVKGLNFAVTACLYLMRENDPEEINDSLIAAANFLKRLQRDIPLEGSLLDVDYWIDDDCPQYDQDSPEAHGEFRYE